MAVTFSQVIREAVAFPAAVAAIPEGAMRERALAAPWHALAFIPEKLDAETLRLCATARPDAAIRWAWPLLSDELARECVRRAPWDALYYVAESLDEAALASCILQEPLAALAYAGKCLTRKMLLDCRSAFHAQVANKTTTQALNKKTSLRKTEAQRHAEKKKA